jgi:hypothetical protein
MSVSIRLCLSICLCVALIFSLRSLFWKSELGLWDHVAVCVCVCVSVSPYLLYNVWTNLYETWYVSTWAHLNGLYKKIPPISMCLYMYPSNVVRQRLSKNPLIVDRQRLGGNFTAVTNTYATIEELMNASFSMRPEWYLGKWAVSFSQNFLFILDISSR